jgi:hypothetical protein
VKKQIFGDTTHKATSNPNIQKAGDEVKKGINNLFKRK